MLKLYNSALDSLFYGKLIMGSLLLRNLWLLNNILHVPSRFIELQI